MSIWGDIAGGAVSGAGYLSQVSDLRDNQQATNDAISDLQQGVMDNGGFQGWGVTSNLGGMQMGQDGQLNMQLNEGQANQQMQQNRWAHDMFQKANQGTAERQQDIFGQLQAQRQPAMDQAYTNLQQNVYGSGTGGMQTANYGGDAQSYAFAKAMNDQAGQDMVNAQGLANAEQLQQMNMGNQYFQNQYQPMQQLGQLAGHGINAGNIMNQANQAQNSLWTDLGLGGITANTNYENIAGKAFGDMFTAGAGLASSAGNTFGDSSWGKAIVDTVGGLFGGNGSFDDGQLPPNPYL